jgi:hypothetical protein
MIDVVQGSPLKPCNVALKKEGFKNNYILVNSQLMVSTLNTNYQ